MHLYPFAVSGSEFYFILIFLWFQEMLNLFKIYISGVLDNILL